MVHHDWYLQFTSYLCTLVEDLAELWPPRAETVIMQHEWPD